MKVWYLFLCVFFVFIACKQDSQEKKNSASVETFSFETIYHSEKSNTLLQGQIANATNEYIVLSKDSFSDTALLTNSGNFIFNIHLKNPEYFYLKDGKNHLKVFLEPDYQLSISYNSNNIFNSIEFTGNGAKPNAYLKDKYLLMLENAITLSSLYEMPVKEFRYLVDSLFVIKKMFFNEFVAETDLPKRFKQTELACLKYDRGTQLMEYLLSSKYAHDINEENYFKFLQKLSVNDSLLLDLYEYRSFLSAYINYFSGKKTQGENRAAHEITLAKMQTTNALIQNQAVKDYLFFILMKDQVKFYGYKNSEALFKIFDLNCKNSMYRNQLLIPYSNYQKLSQTDKAPQITMLSYKGKKVTLNDFKGTYIYIDVWASWCLPCRKESPIFESLSEKFKHKNIEFVSISIDKKKEDWLDFINLKHQYKNQYWIPEIKPFIDAYMIQTIPHFLIIDDKGNLIDNNARRPSEGKTDWIEKLQDKNAV